MNMSKNMGKKLIVVAPSWLHQILFSPRRFENDAGFEGSLFEGINVVGQTKNGDFCQISLESYDVGRGIQ